jgi:hypothetical protein
MAYLKPLCAALLMMVRFTGPTGMDKIRPMRKPVGAAMKMLNRSCMD